MDVGEALGDKRVDLVGGDAADAGGEQEMLPQRQLRPQRLKLNADVGPGTHRIEVAVHREAIEGHHLERNRWMGGGGGAMGRVSQADR